VGIHRLCSFFGGFFFWNTVECDEVDGSVDGSVDGIV
jgi:hypothetical protein